MKTKPSLKKPGQVFSPCMILLVAVLALVGCANTPKSRVHIFTPDDNWQALAGRDKDNCEYIISFALFGFPEYLDRPHIVTRISDTEININEFNRWGIPLDKATFEMLGADLARLLPKAYVELSPRRPPGKSDYLIHLNVIRFDGIPGKTMELLAEWKISSSYDSADKPVRRTTIARSPISDTSYEAYLAAMKQAINAIAEEIAGEIQNLREEA